MQCLRIGNAGTRLASRNSITPSLAFFTTGESVLIFMPGPAGMAHEACGFGLFSTCRVKSSDHEQPFACTENKAEVQLRSSKAILLFSRCKKKSLEMATGLRLTGGAEPYVSYLNKAHAAVPSNRQPLMVAEPVTGETSQARTCFQEMSCPAQKKQTLQDFEGQPYTQNLAF